MQMQTGIIDAWLQHPTVRFIQQPIFQTLRRWTGLEGHDQEIDIDTTIAVMDEAGVERALISAWWGPGGPIISNEEVASFVARHPDRLAGIASVDLYRPMEAVRELRRLVREDGFCGVRILQWLWNLPVTDRRYYPILAECVELGIPLCLQVGHTGPLCPSEPGRPIPYIDEAAIDFPELVFVCGHIGYPWTMEMIAVATKHSNVYIDTSAYTAKRYPPELVQYMKSNGRKKVLFGSNYPMITPKRCLEDRETLGLDEETERLFLRDNARRVFNLP